MPPARGKQDTHVVVSDATAQQVDAAIASYKLSRSELWEQAFQCWLEAKSEGRTALLQRLHTRMDELVARQHTDAQLVASEVAKITHTLTEVAKDITELKGDIAALYDATKASVNGKAKGWFSR